MRKITAPASLRGGDGQHFLRHFEVEVCGDDVAPVQYAGGSYTYSHSIALGNFRDTDGVVYGFVRSGEAA